MSTDDEIIGVPDHGGWAVLVTVAGDGTLLDRPRVELVDEDLPKIPHHSEGQALPLHEAVALEERVRVSAERHAKLGLDAVAMTVPGRILGIALRQCPRLPPTIAERITVIHLARTEGTIFSHKAKRWNPRQPRWPMNRFARSKFNLPRPDSENNAMTPSSTSATGQHSACPVCNPNEPSSIAPLASETSCPRCGYLIWFTREQVGNDQIVKPTVRLLKPDMVEKLIGLETLVRAKRLVLDVREVELMPSPSLGKLVRLNKTVQAACGRLVFRNLSPNLFNVFQITGLDRVFDVEV